MTSLTVTNLNQQVQAGCLVSLLGAPGHPPASPTAAQLWEQAQCCTDNLFPYGGWKDEAAARYTQLRGSDPGQPQLSVTGRRSPTAPARGEPPRRRLGREVTAAQLRGTRVPSLLPNYYSSSHVGLGQRTVTSCTSRKVMANFVISGMKHIFKGGAGPVRLAHHTPGVAVLWKNAS